MFTGIVLERGRVGSVGGGREGVRLVVHAPRTAADAQLGDSVSVDGCCLTVVAVEGERLSFDAVPETLARTTLGGLRKGSDVNLEPSLRVGERLGGHWVQGHVDAVGTVASLEPNGEAVDLVVEAPPALLRYVVEKGSICVAGVSLTVVSVDDRSFSVTLVPHTRAVTTLGALRPGDGVDLEVDILAKYLEKLVSEGLWYDRGPAR